METGSLRLPCGSWGSNLGLQSWQRLPLSVEAAGQFFVSKHILSINVYVYMKHKANI